LGSRVQRSEYSFGDRGLVAALGRWPGDGQQFIAGRLERSACRTLTGRQAMESLYLLIPFSAILVLGILGVFAWALHGGQFEDLEGEGERILTDEAPALDTHQGQAQQVREESLP
jgi:cbb3-type cytochrome oxidase maturation protein